MPDYTYDRPDSSPHSWVCATCGKARGKHWTSKNLIYNVVLTHCDPADCESTHPRVFSPGGAYLVVSPGL